MLTRIADRSRLILYVDDLQWGDADRAALLFRLWQPPDEPSVVFRGCYRADEAGSSPFLRRLSELQKESGRTLKRHGYGFGTS